MAIPTYAGSVSAVPTEPIPPRDGCPSKGADVDSYVADASKRFDWKAYARRQQKQFKIRVGQQKQKKAK